MDSQKFSCDVRDFTFGSCHLGGSDLKQSSCIERSHDPVKEMVILNVGSNLEEVQLTVSHMQTSLTVVREHVISKCYM